VQGAGQFAFVELSDGSCFTCMQVVVNKGVEGWEAVEKNSHIGCSFMFQGEVVESQGKGQAIEIKATRATLFGACDPNLYPLSKGRLPLEHLRSFAHVRPRTNTIGAVARVRSCLATAVHEFFQQKVTLARRRRVPPSAHYIPHCLACRSAAPCMCTPQSLRLKTARALASSSASARSRIPCLSRTARCCRLLITLHARCVCNVCAAGGLQPRLFRPERQSHGIRTIGG
jgi:hypothetical protein